MDTMSWIVMAVGAGVIIISVIIYPIWKAIRTLGKVVSNKGDNWLAKQIKEERRSRAFLEKEGLKVTEEQFVNSRAKELREAHEEYCVAEIARDDVRRE